MSIHTRMIPHAGDTLENTAPIYFKGGVGGIVKKRVLSLRHDVKDLVDPRQPFRATKALVKGDWKGVANNTPGVKDAMASVTNMNNVIQNSIGLMYENKDGRKQRVKDMFSEPKHSSRYDEMVGSFKGIQKEWKNMGTVLQGKSLEDASKEQTQTVSRSTGTYRYY